MKDRDNWVNHNVWLYRLVWVAAIMMGVFMCCALARIVGNI